MGKKAEIIERAEEHARCLAEREKNRVAAAEALLNLRLIADSIQRRIERCRWPAVRLSLDVLQTTSRNDGSL